MFTSALWQVVLCRGQRGTPPKPPGHDPRETLHPHPCFALHCEYRPLSSSSSLVHFCMCLNNTASQKKNEKKKTKPSTLMCLYSVSACPLCLCCAPVTCTPSSTTWASSTTSFMESLLPGRSSCESNSPTCTGQSRCVHLFWFILYFYKSSFFFFFFL